MENRKIGKENWKIVSLAGPRSTDPKEPPSPLPTPPTGPLWWLSWRALHDLLLLCHPPLPTQALSQPMRRNGRGGVRVQVSGDSGDSGNGLSAVMFTSLRMSLVRPFCCISRRY